MSRSTRLTFVCHAATAAMKSAAFPADEPLLEGAAEAIARIRQGLRHAGAVASAPELRTRQTAAALSPDYAVDPALRDIDYGSWAGKDLQQVQGSDPEGLMAWLSSGEAAPHGGESIAAATARIASWLADRIDAGGHTLAVTHPAIIRGAVTAVLRAPLESFWKLDVRPLCVTELTSDGHRWVLRSFGQRLD